MFLQQSSHQPLQPSSAKYLKSMIHNLKIPYLRKVQQAKNRFFQNANKFKMQNQHQNTFQNSFSPSPEPTFQSILNSESSLKLKMQNKRIATQSSCQQIQYESKEPYLGEWVMGEQKASVFKTMGQMLQHYSNTFQRKVKFSKANTRAGDSFILQEKLVIQRIFQEIGDPKQQSIEFTKVTSFFQQCPLFYTIYNIHPLSLLKLLKDSAHRYPDKLTRTEFLNLFLINNRSSKDVQRYNIEKSEKKCLLDQQKWKDIKEVAILFDTFGNQTIQLKQFLHKIKNSVQYKYLLDLEVLSFQTINRTYTLKKILFEIENKLRIGQSFMKWGEIKDMIMNFQHIKDPTIDVLEKEKIKSGKITNFNNNFMLKEQVLDFLKSTFFRCPKYCENFVKMSQFCSQIYETQKSKLYLKEIVRTIPETVNVKRVLNDFSKDNFQYLDLDEILEQFSLKIPTNKIPYKKPVSKEIDLSESESQDQSFEHKIKEKQLNRKESQKHLNKTNCKPTQKKQITVAQQFKLSKKTKESIRQKKLNEMLEQKAAKERQEYKKKIKANPIPASINHQNYEEYKKKLAENKQAIKKQLKKVNEKDELLLKYLEANTKLFEKSKITQSNCSSPTNYTFEHKPVPWFVHVNLLDKINQMKENKNREIRKQTNIKYLRDWKNLPFCAQSEISSTQELPQVIQQCSKHFQEDFLSQNILSQAKIRKKSKVKEVPNFELLQKQFQQSLQKKKMKVKATQIVQFKLTSPKNREKEEQNAPTSPRPLTQSKKRPVQPSNNYIGSTLKYQSMVKYAQEKKIMEQLRRQQQQEEEKRILRGRKMFAKLMRKQLKKQIKSSRSMNNKSRVGSHSDQSEKQLAEMYKRVFSKPFLFQDSAKTKKKFIEANASRVKLTNEKSFVDKFMEDIETEELMYCENQNQEYKQQSAQSNQSI